MNEPSSNTQSQPPESISFEQNSKIASSMQPNADLLPVAKSNWLLKLLIGILVIAVVGGIVYGAFVLGQSIQDKKSLTTVTESPSPAETVAKTTELAKPTEMPTAVTPSPSTQASPTILPSPTPAIPSGWQEVTTPDQKLSFVLPASVQMKQSEDLVQRMVLWFGAVDDSSALVITYGQEGEMLPGWSGLPAGEPQSAAAISMLGQALSKEKLVYEGKTMKIFYGESPLVRQNTQFRISMDWFSAKAGGISAEDEALADQILGLIQLN